MKYMTYNAQFYVRLTAILHMLLSVNLEDFSFVLIGDTYGKSGNCIQTVLHR